MKKQVLVTVDRGETRVAMLEAAGEVTAARRSRRRKKGRKRLTVKLPSKYAGA